VISAFGVEHGDISKSLLRPRSTSIYRHPSVPKRAVELTRAERARLRSSIEARKGKGPIKDDPKTLDQRVNGRSHSYNNRIRAKETRREQRVAEGKPVGDRKYTMVSYRRSYTAGAPPVAVKNRITKARYQTFSGVNLSSKGTLVKLNNSGPWQRKKGLKNPVYMDRRGVPSSEFLRSARANNKKSVSL
jgi:hypothetical protein